MLELKNVNTFYSNLQALRDVSLRVEVGELVALIGANGAGKTTLLNTISGTLHGRSGEIFFDRQPIHRLEAEPIVRLGLSHVPERRQIFADLTVEENLRLGAYTRYGRAAWSEIRDDLARMYALFPILKERAGQKAGTLSGGQQQMLAVARGLMSRPRLLLLDEPSLGLAPLVVQEIFRVLAALRAEGMTILLVEQNARAALRLAARAYVLEGGRVTLSGPASQLLADKDLQAAYLG